MLEEILPQFPLVSTSRHQSTMSYSIAKSIETWRSWSLGKRKSSEVKKNHVRLLTRMYLLQLIVPHQSINVARY